jgi:succinate-semialdehyde dehydrogenase / glutarate-semialdehyde dehydrogenase
MAQTTLPTLTEPGLAQQGLFIDGAWREASDGATLDVLNPATGETICAVASATVDDCREAIASAERALTGWSSTPAPERAEIMLAWHRLVLEHVSDLAAIMTAEQGKPLSEAAGEVRYGAGFLQWYAEEGKRAYGDVIPTNDAGRRLFALKEPIGVCAAITPWNFPMAMIARKAAPALAAGCTMVVKPASEAPLSALALAELARRAGVPPGVLNVVHGPPEVVGSELASNPTVRKLTFTGSTAVGRLLIAQSADSVKKLSMELGGNAPLIVFEDSDPDVAVAGVIASKFRNSGQTCVCANRVLVQDSIRDAFVDRLAAAASKLRVGNGFAEGVEQGPLIDDAAVEKVQAHVADAVRLGARVVAGGGEHAAGARFFEPTVLDGVTPEMLLAREETFGPVAGVMSFHDEQEAIALANDTPFGLASYLFARDVGRIWRVAGALEYGVVAVNTGVFSYEGAPFGGIKQSGIGREGGRQGLEDYLETKYLCLEIADSEGAQWR